MIDELSRRTALSGLGSLAGLASAAGRAAPTPQPASRHRDDLVSVVDFGAVADGATDNSRAFEAAIARGIAIGRPILVPGAHASYKVGRTVHAITGIVGHGPTSCIEAMSPDGFADGQPIVRIGWKVGEGAPTCTVPVTGFYIKGLARRAPARTLVQRDIGFAGAGLLYDQTAAFIHATDVEVQFCARGIDHGNSHGHLGGTNVRCSNNWYNLYWAVNSGDYRYLDCLFAGALFAAYGCHGSNRGGIDVGGVVGLTTIGCHAGFAPYVFYQEDGDGTVGLVGWTSTASSCEQVGNQVVRLGATKAGQRRVSGDWAITRVGHSWTTPGTSEHQGYALPAATQPPARRVAVELDLVQVGPIVMSGHGWTPAAPGAPHTVIRDLLHWVRDDNGIGGYSVTGQGAERLIHGASPRLARQQRISLATLSQAKVPLASFEVPPSFDNTPEGELNWTLTYERREATSLEVRLVVAVNGNVVETQRQHLSPGLGNLSGSLRFPLSRRDRSSNRHQVTVEATIATAPATVRLAGIIGFTVAQDSGTV